MYNEERKLRYTEIRENSVIIQKDALKRMFTNIEESERRLNKDACEFLENEILAYYKTLGTRSLLSLTNINSQFSTYTDWCLGKGYVPDGQNHYRVLVQKDLEKCINLSAIEAFSITREELIDQLRQLPNAREQFLILYIYEVGMKDISEDLREMTLDWFEGNVLHLPDRDVTVSDELRHFAEEAAVQDRVYSYITEKSFPLVVEGKIFSWRANTNMDTISATKFAIIFRKAMDFLGYDGIRQKEIELLGMKDTLKRLADKEGISIERAIYRDDVCGKMLKQYGREITPSAFYRKIKGYL